MNMITGQRQDSEAREVVGKVVGQSLQRIAADCKHLQKMQAAECIYWQCAQLVATQVQVLQTMQFLKGARIQRRDAVGVEEQDAEVGQICEDRLRDLRQLVVIELQLLQS